MNKLLLIEDDADILEVVKEVLEEEGLSVHAVSSFTEGKQALTQNRYQLILTDFRTQMGNDWERLHELRGLAGATPMGVMSGWRLEDHELQRHGVSFLIRKPFSAEELFAIVARHLRVEPLSETHRKLIQEYFQCLMKSDWKRLGELVTDDFVYNLPGSSPQFSTTVSGRERFRKFSEQTFAHFTDPKFYLKVMSPLPEGALVTYRAEWKGKAQRESTDGAVLFHFEGNAISRVGVRADLKHLTEQVEEKTPHASQ
jgi:CheY-like chemotaxis protein